MRITNETSENLKRLAVDFAQAKVDLSWIGACDVASHNGIKRRYAESRKALFDEIERIVGEAAQNSRHAPSPGSQSHPDQIGTGVGF